MGWYIPVIPAVRRLRQKDGNLDINLSYNVARVCVRKIKGAEGIAEGESGREEETKLTTNVLLIGCD